MRIEHVAIWTRDLEGLRAFYERWFGARAGERYERAEHGYSSYFLDLDAAHFGGGAIGLDDLAFGVDDGDRNSGRLQDTRPKIERASQCFATGTTSPPSAAGKLASQVGSWTITGTTSQPRETPSSHASSGTGSRKSERTKRKLPGGSVRE